MKIRPILPQDAANLVDIFAHMSSESRYRRFLQSVDHVGPTRVWQEAERIANTPPEVGRGVIAFDMTAAEEVPVGVARYVVVEPGVAELAVSVRDDYQSDGIGTALLQMLTETAVSAGILKLIGTIQNENEAIWRVLNHLPYAIRRYPQGTISEIVVMLDQPRNVATKTE